MKDTEYDQRNREMLYIHKLEDLALLKCSYFSIDWQNQRSVYQSFKDTFHISIKHNDRKKKNGVRPQKSNPSKDLQKNKTRSIKAPSQKLLQTYINQNSMVLA